jgi:hypothetical protein
MRAPIHFRRLALLIAVTAVAAASGIAVVGSRFLIARDSGGLGAFAALGAVWVLLALLAVQPVRYALALRHLERLHPDGLVFLAARQPTLAPDLPAYMAAKGYDADVSQGWYAALVDERGISAWSVGARTRELLLMPWSELGAIVECTFTTVEGRSRRGISVDVAPYETPLIVTVGFAAYGVTAEFGRAGTAEVAASTAAMRPAPA